MQLILSNSYCEVSCNSSQSAKVALVTVTCSAARSTWKLNRYESRWVPYVPLGKWTKNGNWEPSVSVYFFFRFFFDPNFLHIRNKQQTKRRYKNHGQLWSLTVFSCNMKWRPLTQFVWNSDQLYFWKVVFQKLSFLGRSPCVKLFVQKPKCKQYSLYRIPVAFFHH